MEETPFNEIHFLELETLSPVHVGSGTKLKREFEYLEFAGNDADDYPVAAITDLEKVLRVLGANRIPQWINSINNGESTLKLLKQARSNLKPTDISSRVIELAFKKRKMEEFNEMILTGDGEAYIPGSSLKGAFRTALLAEGLRAGGKSFKDLGGRGWKSKIEKFFGPDMNSDVLRFLSPSDAIFSRTQCVAIDIINRYHNGWKAKEMRDPLFLEVIPRGEIAYTRLALPNVMARELRRHHNQDIDLHRIPRLAPLLLTTHAHNMRLLAREIAFWEQQGLPAITGKYYDYLKAIHERASTFDPETEALIRVGFATGWKSITGEWQEYCMSDFDFGTLMDELRKMPVDYPKTRKLAFGRQPLGYMRIRVCATDQRFMNKRPASDVLEPYDPIIGDPLPEDPIQTSDGPAYHPGPIRKGTEVEAEYCPQPKDQGAMKTFKLFLIEPGKEQMVALRYPAPLPAGQRAKVRINDIDAKTGVIRAIEFRGKL